MQSREPSAARATSEAAILLSLVFGGMVVSGWSLTLQFALPPLLPSPFDLLGWVVMTAAAASLAYSGRILSARGRGTPYPRRPPRSLVTTGPYARVRNPILLSWAAILVGLAFALRISELLILLVPTALIVHLYVVVREEPLLVRRFGAAFEDYRRRVPRWIPRLRV